MSKRVILIGWDLTFCIHTHKCQTRVEMLNIELQYLAPLGISHSWCMLYIYTVLFIWFWIIQYLSCEFLFLIDVEQFYHGILSLSLSQAAYVAEWLPFSPSLVVHFKSSGSNSGEYMLRESCHVKWWSGDVAGVVDRLGMDFDLFKLWRDEHVFSLE